MTDQVRKSRRKAGLAPECPPLLAHRAKKPVIDIASESGSWKTTTSTRTGSTAVRRKLEAELKAMEETAAIEAKEIELEKKKLEQLKALRKKKLEVELSVIDEEENDNNSQKLNDDESESPPNDTELTQEEKDQEINNWVSVEPEVKATYESPGVEGTVPPTDTAPSNMQEMIQAITTAFTNVSNQTKPNDYEMKKFVARQATSKDLPFFFGDPEDWPTFISEFRGATEDCGFSNRENMARLRKSLKGKAKDAVSSMMVSPDNVNQVIETLETSFGRPELIIATLIVKARKLQNPREDRIETIIEYSNAVQNLVTTMQTLKKTAHVNNPQLMMTDLVEKLPSSFKMQWALQVGLKDTESTLQDLSDWLKRFAKAMSAISAPKIFENNTKYEKPRDYRPQRRWNNEREVVCTTSDSSERNTGQECKFCQRKGHAIFDCKIFSKEPVTRRWDIAKENNLCFVCLHEGHGTASCRNKKKCGKDNCDSLHHRLLHRYKPPPAHSQVPLTQSQGTPVQPSPAPSKQPTTSVNDEPSLHISTSCPPNLEKKVLLRVVPVRLRGPACEISTYAILDSASTTTIIDSATADRLGLQGETEIIRLKWLKDEPKNEECKIVNLKISDAEGKNEFQLSRVKSINNLELPTQTVRTDELAKIWKHVLKGNAHSFENAVPTILIGEDNADLTLARETYQGPKNAPILSRTKLGWIVHGTQNPLKGRVDHDYLLHVFTNENDDILHQLVKDSFKTEAFGVKVVEHLPESKVDTRAKRILEETTRRVGDRWETGLLWKEDEFKFPESKMNAIYRLQTKERRMERDAVFEKLYREKISEYLQKGYARKLTKEDAAITDDRTYYIPHFAVSNPNKPGKIRFVFDAASKSKGVSLNDALLSGPDLLSPLINVLVMFRQRLIGFTGDICEMFHQVAIRKEDRSSQRFVWRENRNEQPEVMEMAVMTFGSTCSPCSAQYVKNKNAMEFIQEYPDAVKAITQRHYVDDYLDSTDSEEDAVKMLTDVTEVHRRGGFQIKNFCCSSKKVLEHFGSLGQVETKHLNLEDTLPIERVLGLYWDPNKDCFKFSCKFHKVKQDILNGIKRPTKREIASLNASIYDPLGFLGNFTIRTKIIIQDIWRTGIGWDDELPEKVFNKWKLWLSELKRIENVEIPRCYSTSSDRQNIQLHLMCDAGKKAFAAVAYLRIDNGGSVEVSFVYARTRVTPVKSISIPRAELQGAVMASRMSKYLKETLEYQIDAVRFWTDSQTVLWWLRNDAVRCPPFVVHRIGEILEETDVGTWHWVPTKENAADDATRDTPDTNLKSNSRWLRGPEFLKMPESEWPNERKKIVDLHAISEESLEMKPECLKPEFVNLIVKVKSYLPDATRFSKYRRLIRATAWILRFVWNIQAKKLKKEKRFGELLPFECQRAEKIWWQQSQRQSFPEEMLLLKAGKSILKTSKLLPFSPWIDNEGLMRLKGRIHNSPAIPKEGKTQVLLDPKNYITKLLVKHYHEKSGHRGMETVVNEIRQRFWILRMRAAVRFAFDNCQMCKIEKAKPLPPTMGLLPSVRVTQQARPFAVTGMDYFGPIDVVVGRRREKRYGVLFTCLSTRAIHLEIASSLTTDSAIMAIRRFVGRRGCPKDLFSDNGTNLRGADVELRKSLKDLDQEQIVQDLTTLEITWHFIPPGAPNMGGSWERLVQTVKKSLKVILKEQAPRDEVLQTLFVEVEHTVNSRPLTYVPVDPEDEEALTPNHFLIGRSSIVGVPGVFTIDDKFMRKQWRISQFLADCFWSRWVREYLPSLTRRGKWHLPVKPIKVGDLVIVADNNLQRNSWPRGVVTAVYPGRDGIIRVADVRTKTGVFRRPVSKLCILDVEKQEVNGPVAPFTGEVMSARPADLNPPTREQEENATKGHNFPSASGERKDDSVVQQEQAEVKDRNREQSPLNSYHSNLVQLL